jgi:hypothetical protein
LLVCVTNVIWIKEEEEKMVMVAVDEKKGRQGYCIVHSASAR